MNLAAYKTAQRYLESLPSIQGYMTKRRHPSFYLERMRILLSHLRHPEKGFDIIHVTGTSGKGSVTMMLHNIIAASGKRVGSYLSPHTTTVVERILINGRTISVADFIWGVEAIKGAVSTMLKKGHEYAPSYFEALFAVSLLIFHKRNIRWLVLEVGCGGEFDATNTIPSPRAAIVTNVHLDHMHLLGRKRSLIAKTKSGIIKPGSSVFTGEQDPRIRAIIQQQAKRCKNPFTYVPPPRIKPRFDSNGMTWNDPSVGNMRMHLLGLHQQHNAALAIHVAQALGFSRPSIRKGLANTHMPCRTEIMQRLPLVMLDGAHNPIKIHALVKLLRSLPIERIHAIVGIGHNKQHAAILKSLAPVINDIIFTKSSVDLPAPEDPKRLLRIFSTLSKKPARCIKNPREALKYALRKSAPGDWICVTGSLYLTGEIRTHWVSEQAICTHTSSFL